MACTSAFLVQFVTNDGTNPMSWERSKYTEPSGRACEKVEAKGHELWDLTSSSNMSE